MSNPAMDVDTNPDQIIVRNQIRAAIDAYLNNRNNWNCTIQAPRRCGLTTTIYAELLDTLIEHPNFGACVFDGSRQEVMDIFHTFKTKFLESNPDTQVTIHEQGNKRIVLIVYDPDDDGDDDADDETSDPTCGSIEWRNPVDPPDVYLSKRKLVVRVNTTSQLNSTE